MKALCILMALLSFISGAGIIMLSNTPDLYRIGTACGAGCAGCGGLFLLLSAWMD